MSSFIPGLILTNTGIVNTSITNLQTRTINANNTRFGMTVQAEVSATVNQVGFNFAAITGTPGNLIFSIGTVDNATGIYGTDLATATVAATSLTYSGTGSIQWVTLNTSVSLTRGQFYSIRVTSAATGWDASNFITLFYGTGVNDDTAIFSNTALPYGVSGGAKLSTGIGGVRNSTTGTVYGCIALTVGDASNATVGTYVGSVFTLPTSWSSANLIGLCQSGRYLGNSTETWGLYSVTGGVGTLIASTTFDSDYQISQVPNTKFVYLNGGTLNSGTTYFIGRNGLSTNTTFLRRITFTNAAEMDPYQRGGFVVQAATLDTASGNAVATLNNINFLFPVFSSVTKTSGGGGGGSFTTAIGGGFNG